MQDPAEIGFWAVVLVAAYKLACLATGFGFAWMGYRLFAAGIEGPHSQVQASAGRHSLRLSRVAPGTFFALFGAGVVAATVYQGFDVEIPDAARRVLLTLPAEPADLRHEP